MRRAPSNRSRTEPAAEGLLTNRPFDSLQREFRLLREESQRVRSNAEQLRQELRVLFDTTDRIRKQLSGRLDIENGSDEPIHTVPEAPRVYNGSILDAIEDERKRIGRELHDDLNQQVAWLKLKASGLEHWDSRNQELRGTDCRLLREGLQRLSERISKISHRLHPAILTDLGLEAAVRSCVTDFAENEAVTATFRSKKVPRDVPPQVGICIYRILQEALHNVSKHARTKKLLVSLLAIRGERIRLSIRDYGRGIRKQNGKPALGLISMEERARLMNGRFALWSEAGKGTRIVVTLPLAVVSRGESEPSGTGNGPPPSNFGPHSSDTAAS